jgi:preprotein translocase subunit SecA
LLEYDDVANDQRKVIYQLRDELMGTEDVKGRYNSIREKVIGELFEEYISPQILEEDWDIGGLESALKAEYGLFISLQKSADNGLDVDEILGVVLQGLIDSHDAKEAVVGAETMRTFEKAVMLRALDHYWKEHLATMDHLRQSVNLRGYAHKNPVQEFKRESFTMFTSLLDTIDTEMVKALCSVNVDQKRESAEVNVNERQPPKTSVKQAQNITKPKPAQLPKKAKKIGRNDPCPCGSGKKYKRCHG